MNYQAIYDRIVARGKERVIEGYKERHHIIPRCMGGSDESDNLVDLTPEEHFICHQLLVKIHPTNKKLVYAASIMSRNSNGCRPNNKMYGWLKKRFVDAQRRSKTIYCLHCGKPKEVMPHVKAKFCDKKCSGLFRLTLTERECRECGELFTVRAKTTNASNFCSKKCYWNNMKKVPTYTISHRRYFSN